RRLCAGRVPRGGRRRRRSRHWWDLNCGPAECVMLPISGRRCATPGGSMVATPSGRIQTWCPHQLILTIPWALSPARPTPRVRGPRTSTAPLRSCSREKATKATRIRTADQTTAALDLSCRRTLETWAPPNREQNQLRRHYLDHLARQRDGWSRACVGAHLTASSLICAAAERMGLLTLHARWGKWLQTGGHVESPDPPIEAAAAREAREESGLADLRLEPSPLLLSKHEVPCGPTRPTYHLDVQYLVLANHLSPAVGEESLDVRWFVHDQLPEVDDSVVALVRAAGTRLGWKCGSRPPPRGREGSGRR